MGLPSAVLLENPAIAQQAGRENRIVLARAGTLAEGLDLDLAGQAEAVREAPFPGRVVQKQAPLVPEQSAVQE